MKILIFSPYSAIWQHTLPEAIIGETLHQEGHTLYYATCHHLFQDGCVAMDAAGKSFSSSSQERALICKRCTAQRKLILQNFPFQEIALNQFFTTDDRLSVELTLNTVTQKNCLDFFHEEIPIGKIALSLILLKYKKINLSFSEAEWKDYLTEIKYALYTLISGKKLLNQLTPDRILIYNTQYPVNQVISQLGQATNTPIYYLHAGTNISQRLRTLCIGHQSMRFITLNLFKAWKEKYINVPCSSKAAMLVTQHYKKLLDAKNFLVYSSPTQYNKNIRDYFSIKPNQKIILCTMSSYDEMFSAKMLGTINPKTELLFHSQIEWIADTIKHIKEHPDLFLIIRIHPREFPNKRESIKSEHAYQLEKILVNLPSNIKVNWPSDDLSLYDFSSSLNLCLNFISTVGKELVLFGVPVITYASQELLLYPQSLNYVIRSKKEYYQAILHHVNTKLDFEKIRLLYRWYALEFIYSQLDLSDSLTLEECHQFTIGERIKNKIRRTLDPLFKQKKDCENRSRALKYRKMISEMIENNYPTLLLCNQDIPNVSLDEEATYIKNSIAEIKSIIRKKTEKNSHQNI